MTCLDAISPAAPAAGASSAVVDREANSGFVICDAGTAALRVLYADVGARRVLAGHALVGASLDAVFELADDGGLARRLQRAVADGEHTAFVTCARGRDGVARDVHALVQPLAAADGRSPWALCTFEVAGAADLGAAAVVADEPPAEIGAIVARLAARLSFLLPGRIDVQVALGDTPQWVAAAADDVEAIVASCLAVAVPVDPWQDTVKLAVATVPAAGRVRLAFGRVGDRDGAMAEGPLPPGVGEQLAALGFELERDGSLAGCRGLALVMPLVADGHAVGREEASG